MKRPGRSTWLYFLAAGAISLSLANGPSVEARDGEPFVGTYLGTYDLSVFGIPEPANFVLQIRADGTVTGSDDSDFGAVGVTPQQTPLYGQWRRTGPRSIAAKVVFLSVGNVERFGEHGIFRGFNVVEMQLEFVKDLQEFTLIAVERFYLPGSHPLDPDSDPVFVSPEVPGEGRRFGD